MTSTTEEFKKDEGIRLVNLFAELSSKKNEIENQLNGVKQNLILFAKQEGINMIYGSNKKASIKEYVKVIYPEDKQPIIDLLKKKGLYEEYSMLCTQRLNSAILKNKMTDKTILDLTIKESDYRVSLSDKGDEKE